ncbi:hypothetical protein DHD32_15040 [Arenibacter sp. TNZ]|nr:hypothetical protein [Arenibacter sp. TNZ]
MVQAILNIGRVMLIYVLGKTQITDYQLIKVNVSVASSLPCLQTGSVERYWTLIYVNEVSHDNRRDGLDRTTFP